MAAPRVVREDCSRFLFEPGGVPVDNTEARKEPFFQRNAWIILIVVAAIFALFGLGDMVLGMDADPAIAESMLGTEWESFRQANPAAAYLIDMQSMSQGAVILALSLLIIAVAANAFRRGESWAWYALWVLPLWNAAIFLRLFTADLQPDFAAPPPMISAPIFFAITALALVLSYPKFFAKAE